MVGKSKSKKDRKQQKHAPLEDEIQEDKMILENKSRNKLKKRKQIREKNEYIEEKMTKKILGSVRRQQIEEEQEEEGVEGEDQMEFSTFDSRNKKIEEEEFISEGEKEEIFEIEKELDQITEEDEKALQMFMSNETPKRQTLADIVMEKIEQFKLEESQKQSSNLTSLHSNEQVEERVKQRIDPKIFSVYKSLGKLLSTYTSGKFPKAFKVIPALGNWEEILFLTNPENWSPSTVYQATRLFASNLNAKMAQRFYNLVLLPRVRSDIKEHKKLNFYLYLALKKSIYKPAAFYKGILLPVCEAGDCTLREATIISSVLSKVSVPVLHSSVAILKIAEMPYSGANSLYLKTLLNKKYALPYRVIDALVMHFGKFLEDPRAMPVLWHQSLLTFVQRYKSDLLPGQKELLKALTKTKFHQYFSEEVKRELVNSSSRGEQSNLELPIDEVMELDGLED